MQMLAPVFQGANPYSREQATIKAGSTHQLGCDLGQVRDAFFDRLRKVPLVDGTCN